MANTLQHRLDLFRELAQKHEAVYLLESNGYEDPFGRFRWILLAGSKRSFRIDEQEEKPWERLRSFLNEPSDAPYLPGFLSYDLKNSLEALSSTNPDQTHFPLMSFVEPEFILGEDRLGNSIEYGIPLDFQMPYQTDEKVYHLPEISMVPMLSEDEYTQRFNELHTHILRGDIYEVNYCMHFGTHVPALDPVELFRKLNSLSPAPFACLMKNGQEWLMGSSPERFLNKRGSKLISQPIKGTVRKTGNSSADLKAAEILKADPKERAENVMIVDLVRNDLTPFAMRGSVQVDELCGIYPFATVMHMISTVSAELVDERQGLEALMNAFPMGSMTGAPKIRAMQLAEKAENFRRGIYSGALGYFTPSGDFDFGVMIRSFTWNAKNGYLSFSAGSAITHKAQAASEYRECLLKAEALLNSLRQ